MELLDRPVVRMPEFGPGEWLNAPRPLSPAALRGKVVLVDFWDYSCINCLRTLPYLANWHERYADAGLVTVGVHAPEFAFGRSRAQIELALAEHDVRYPVLLDNAFTTWDRFANRAWPTKHLVDGRGYIRYRKRGEGGYLETERAIQLLLREANPQLSLPDPLPPLRPEDAPGAVCFRPTPELYAGYGGGGLFGGALGNPEGYVSDGVVAYELPDAADLREGHFYLHGFWRAGREAMSFAAQASGRVVVPYSAAGVNAVLSPSADPVAIELDLAVARPWVEIRQDGRPLPPEYLGADIGQSEGSPGIWVTRPRLYELVRLPRFETHQLELDFRSPGLAFYTFTFNSCVRND